MQLSSSPEMRNVFWHDHQVGRQEREAAQGHAGLVVWLTGLSGSGKSTLAGRVEAGLHQAGYRTALLDGDNLRHGLNRDLDFTPAGRQENIRRAGAVAGLMLDAGLIVLCAFVSPYAADRRGVRAGLPANDFMEVHVSAPLAVCRERDPKGLYSKHAGGAFTGLTGVDAPYESPEHPELYLDTGALSVEEACERLYLAIVARVGTLPRNVANK